MQVRLLTQTPCLLGVKLVLCYTRTRDLSLSKAARVFLASTIKSTVMSLSVVRRSHSTKAEPERKRACTLHEREPILAE
jgi:hypothetical protein